MHRVSELRPETRLALLLLEEVALRGGSAKLRFLKTYRYLVFWLGRDYACYFIERLREGGYIDVEGEKVRLRVQVSPSLSYSRLVRLAEETVKELYVTGSRLPRSRHE